MPAESKQFPLQNDRSCIAYVLKGYPRLTDTFITSEVYRMEQQGLRLRVFVILPCTEPVPSDLLDKIFAKPLYMPATTSMKNASLLKWLSDNLKHFLPSLRRVVRKHPFGALRAAGAAFMQAVRAREQFWSWPRKVYAKEFLQGVMLADLLEQAGDVSHIHGHYCHGATTVTWFASMMTKLPFSFTAHAKDIYLPSLNPAGLLRRKMDAARFVITCTDANRDYLENLGSKTPVHCVYHGLNAELCNIMKEQPALRETNGHFRVLGVGRLIPKKGFDILVKACAILHKKRVLFEAIIVAEGGEHEKEIRRLIAANGLENNVLLPGPMSQSQLFSEYQKASAFCLPCRVLENGDRDGIPNVLMEAMAVGVPVVSTPISGIPELIDDGVNGLLVPSEDPVALAEAFLRLTGNSGLAANLSRNGRETIQSRFNGDTLAARMAGLFRECAA
ncbi:MAG TPA: glycosyltransferase [Candidatus Angelobacter sp.]|nr:glycosyltransferase [Candidatus Angelobacter sp.]